MKRHMAIWGLTAGVLVGLPLIGTADDQGSKQSMAKEAQGGPVVHTAVYQPPRKGAPAVGTRRGGGTRGPNKSVSVISLLAPAEHVGWTLQEQPVLYWFTPTKQDSAFTFEFTMISDASETPVIETKLPAPVQAGLQTIKLSDYKVKLSPGERYIWAVSLIVDAEERSANVVAKGAIERVDREKLDKPLTVNFSDADAATRYAEAGIWYDAIMAVTNNIQSNPANAELRQQRAALLKDIGLDDVAKNDLMTRPN